MQHTFLYISLPLFCTTLTWNFQKLLSYAFNGGNVIRVLVHFFSAAHFHLAFDWWPLAFLTAATKFSCCCFNKKTPLLFLSLALDLCRPFSRWAPLACRLRSLFLYFSLALYSKFVGMIGNLSLITLDNTDTETISAFRFHLYWLFSCLCFTRSR